MHTKIKPSIDLSKWHRWYAWHPVDTVDGYHVWFEWIWRRMSYYTYDNDAYYRFAEPEESDGYKA